MNISSKSKPFLATFLLALIVGSILIKPIHVVLIHHDITGIQNVGSTELLISNSHHHDCMICDFEFCTFIQQNQFQSQDVQLFFTRELSQKTSSCQVNKESHHFLLRAPPVF